MTERDSFPPFTDSFEEMFRRVFGQLPDRRRPSGDDAPIVLPPPADPPTGSSHFHVYLGTIGQRGAYQAMRTGYVDEAWAREHHDHWYEDVKAGRSRQAFAGDVPDDVRLRVRRALEPR